MSKVSRLVTLSVLLALAIIIGYFESFIPTLFIPGVKLGLANIVLLICLWHYRWYETIIIVLLRVFVVSLLTGTFLTIPFFMSLTGAIFAYGVMLLVKILKMPSIIFISILGSLFHVIGQIIVAIIAMQTVLVIYYLPFIILLSIPTGILTGIIARTILKTNYFKTLPE